MNWKTFTTTDEWPLDRQILCSMIWVAPDNKLMGVSYWISKFINGDWEFPAHQLGKSGSIPRCVEYVEITHPQAENQEEDKE